MVPKLDSGLGGNLYPSSLYSDVTVFTYPDLHIFGGKTLSVFFFNHLSPYNEDNSPPLVGELGSNKSVTLHSALASLWPSPPAARLCLTPPFLEVGY